ncbi:gtpase obg [Nannochloropsis gaditana]|uniref:Gtpase obg n=1 Tax=Nannochloropsis gaditana TaxID=72520 RepID=W7TDW4_9STRA|nr:gtpase obg [Nannochloropsis gaditana]
MCSTSQPTRRKKRWGGGSTSTSKGPLLLLVLLTGLCGQSIDAFLQVPSHRGSLSRRPASECVAAVTLPRSEIILKAGKRGGGGGKYDSPKRKQAHLQQKGLGRNDLPPASSPSSSPPADPPGVLWEGEEEGDDEDEEEMDAEILEFQGLMERGAFQLLDPDDVEIDEAYDAFDAEDEDEDEDEGEEGAEGGAERGESRPRNDPEWQFFDTAKVFVKGGDGGDGCVAFRREKYVDMGGPNGGSGGGGGSIYFRCDEGLNTLSGLRQKVHWKAGGGARGQGKSRTGATAPDVVVDVPPGTIVRTQDGTLAGQLVEHGERVGNRARSDGCRWN